MVVTKCSPFEFHIFSASKRKKKKKAHTFKENPKTEKKKIERERNLIQVWLQFQGNKGLTMGGLLISGAV